VGPLADVVDRAVPLHGIDPQSLELELTESPGIIDDHDVLRQMDGLADVGIGLAVDDLGHRYTSIAFVRLLQFTRLNIDRSFVRNLQWNTRDFMVVESLSRIASSFGLEIVAEGVATVEQVATLRGFGGHVLQGFHLSKPMAAEATLGYLLNAADNAA
jgi:diguanylate cyclase